ncbi:RHS repeat-associated core domain-containing protein [Dyadobacter sp. CY323]|uniref:RHS repeat-associated core domain-containing protein n=1 Tax=Dyadobacter sp. CY323 TaxID=2907302 RepID=UPI001F230DE5|nr:RHS repeat-associated core domain-containing protein [Dyadobacter sp. CY323]MCE6992282.1 polymorphic toxin type 44 domain-containing protein [Dyadobacter sp. CY323]
MEIDRNSPVTNIKIRNEINRYLFNGIERQPETGIYQARYRGLDPAIGRWMQIDPKPNLSVSLYAAMNNNPVRFSDPLGDTTIVNNRGVVQKQYGGDNIIYQQGRKGTLTQIGEFGKSVDISGILPNVMKDNKNAAKMMGALGFANAVRPGGKWDYKDVSAQKGNLFGAAAQYEKSTDRVTSFTSGKLNFIEGGADFGNYNFGYTGRYVGGDGYSPVTLWGAAGILQTGKDLIKKLG